MWDAPTLLHPHFGRGLRDFTVQRIFYEPLAAAAPDGTLVPVLAEEHPEPQGKHARQGRSVGDLAAQAQRGLARRRPVHRRRRDLQLGVRHRSGHRGGDPRRPTRTSRGSSGSTRTPSSSSSRSRSPTGPPRSPAAGCSRATSSRPVKGAGAREAIGMIPAVGHRALPAHRVPARRPHPGRDQQELPRAESAVLRPARHQVRRRRGGRGARGAADRRVRLRLLRAGGGGGPAADRAGRQGPRPHDPEQRR